MKNKRDMPIPPNVKLESYSSGKWDWLILAAGVVCLVAIFGEMIYKVTTLTAP